MYFNVHAVPPQLALHAVAPGVARERREPRRAEPEPGQRADDVGLGAAEGDVELADLLEPPESRPKASSR